MKLEIDVIPDRGLCLNGAWFTRAVTPEEYVAVLGRPSRVDEGPQRAPVGHRNNHRYVYDDFGLTLLDHHATLLVEAVEVWYDTGFLKAGPRTPFAGRASIRGAAIGPRMTTDDLAARSIIDGGLGHFAVGGAVCTLDMINRRDGGARYSGRERWTVRMFGIAFVERGRPSP